MLAIKIKRHPQFKNGGLLPSGMSEAGGLDLVVNTSPMMATQKWKGFWQREVLEQSSQSGEVGASMKEGRGQAVVSTCYHLSPFMSGKNTPCSPE